MGHDFLSSNPFKYDSSDDEQDEEVDVKKDDIASRFGMQLKGKGTPGFKESFFFQEEDERLDDGQNFFFKQEVDLDDLRVKYNVQRPLLSAILKKKMRQKAKKNEKMKFGGSKKDKVFNNKSAAKNRRKQKTKINKKQ